MLFADPPYNLGIPYDGHDDRIPAAEYRAWSERWIGAAVRLLTDDGSMWLLCNHEWSPHLRLAMEAAGLHFRQTVIWYEAFGTNCTHKFNRCTRPLFWMVRDPKRFVFRPSDVTVSSARLRVYRDKRANPAGKVMDDLWSIPRVAGTHRERMPGFPTQLPMALLRPIVACASDPGDMVCDPFVGSGTTGAVCIELGRRFIGIEQSGGYATRSRQRLGNVTPLLAIG